MKSRIIVIFFCLFYLHSLFTRSTANAGKQKIKKKVCYVGVPQRARTQCQTARAKELAKKRVFYKMSGPQNIYPFPHLDHPAKTAIGYFLKEKFHAKWSYLYYKVLMKSREKASNATKMKYGKSFFTSYENYTKLEKYFRDTLMNETADSTHFQYASKSYKYFVNLEKDEKFREDDYFAQLRLSGLNPMAISRVSLEGNSGTNYDDLKTRLNPQFDWEDAVISVTEDDSIEESIEENKVYVVEYPGLDGVKQMPDLLAKYNPGKKMRNNQAEIALFAVDEEKRLRAIAIQNRATKDGVVYTPRDGLQWTISKADLHINDILYSSVVEHLLKTHFKMEPICVSMNRHLSILHPIHQIFQYHCRGLLSLNAYGLPALLHANVTIRSLFSHGNQGTIQVILKEYSKMVWNDIDLEVNIKKRGMDDRRQLPYYPYRDDGRLVNRVLRRFANRLIRLYYRRDKNVRRDFELQNMIGELSQRKGSPHANKISKVKGLPYRFQSKRQLSNFVRQVLWIVVQHSMLSYPTADYGKLPTYPTKLYDSQKQGQNLDFVQMLVQPVGAILQEYLSSGVGVYRYDVMFDYWKHLKNRKLKSVVMRAYKEMSMAQRYIQRRNRRRHAQGLLTNPFMMQDWLPNSIST